MFLRSDDIASQTVYQFQKKAKKCKNLRSYGVASGSNALSYMSFVAAVITLVVNINNNINANNNNDNQVNLNFGNNNNLVTNLNQNVGNNFNLMFPPGKRKKRSISTRLDHLWLTTWRELHTDADCKAILSSDTDNTGDLILLALQAFSEVML